MRRTSILLSLVVLGSAVSLPAQTPGDETRYAAVHSNLRSVEARLETDQASYFPGEAIRLTLTMQNASAVRLEIPKPFLEVNWLRLFRLESDGRRIPIGSEPESHGEITPAVLWGTETLQPRGLRSIAVYSDEQLHPQAGACVLAPYCAAPREPGQYEVAYSLGRLSVSARFNVMEGVQVEAEAVTKMPRNERDETAGIPLYTYRTAVAFIVGGVSYVCVGRSNLRLHAEESNPNDLASRSAYSPRAPLQRVVSTTAGVRDLRLVASNNDDLTLSWKDGQGRDRSVQFNEKLEQLR